MPERLTTIEYEIRRTLIVFLISTQILLKQESPQKSVGMTLFLRYKMPFSYIKFLLENICQTIHFFNSITFRLPDSLPAFDRVIRHIILMEEKVNNNNVAGQYTLLK